MRTRKLERGRALTVNSVNLMPAPTQAILLRLLEQTIFRNLNVITLNSIHQHLQFLEVDIPTYDPPGPSIVIYAALTFPIQPSSPANENRSSTTADHQISAAASPVRRLIWDPKYTLSS